MDDDIFGESGLCAPITYPLPASKQIVSTEPEVAKDIITSGHKGDADDRKKWDGQRKEVERHEHERQSVTESVVSIGRADSFTSGDGAEAGTRVAINKHAWLAPPLASSVPAHYMEAPSHASKRSCLVHVIIIRTRMHESASKHVWYDFLMQVRANAVRGDGTGCELYFPCISCDDLNWADGAQRDSVQRRAEAMLRMHVMGQEVGMMDAARAVAGCEERRLLDGGAACRRDHHTRRHFDAFRRQLRCERLHDIGSRAGRHIAAAVFFVNDTSRTTSESVVAPCFRVGVSGDTARVSTWICESELSGHETTGPPGAYGIPVDARATDVMAHLPPGHRFASAHPPLVMYHGTDMKHVGSIARVGLKPSSKPGMLGTGIYCAGWEKALHFANFDALNVRRASGGAICRCLLLSSAAKIRKIGATDICTCGCGKPAVDHLGSRASGYDASYVGDGECTRAATRHIEWCVKRAECILVDAIELCNG
jgi:hypothetical protein